MAVTNRRHSRAAGRRSWMLGIKNMRIHHSSHLPLRLGARHSLQNRKASIGTYQTNTTAPRICTSCAGGLKPALREEGQKPYNTSSRTRRITHFTLEV